MPKKKEEEKKCQQGQSKQLGFHALQNLYIELPKFRNHMEQSKQMGLHNM